MRKKQVTIDISPLNSGHAHRGIGTYTKNLVEALQNIDSEFSFTLAKTKEEIGKPDLIHYPYFDLFFNTLPLKKIAPTIVTIHDVIPLEMRKEYPAGIKGTIRYWKQRLSLLNTSGIITDSKASQNAITKHLRIKQSKIHPIYLAADSRYKKSTKQAIEKTKQKYGLDEKYLLYVGDINVNKNILGLIDGYAKSGVESNLVIVSKAMTNDIPESAMIRKKIMDEKLGNKVLFLTEVPGFPETDLQDLYSGADFYIQPSYLEGFGLPILEAMQCGTPVLSSNGGSLLEVIGGGALVFYPEDTDNIAETIKLGYKLDKQDMKELLERGQENLKRFSWDKTAEQTLEVYRKYSI